MRAVLAMALVLGLAAPVAAQRPVPRNRDCPTPAGWAKPERHIAAKGPRFQFGLKPDTSHVLQLHVQRSVNLATKQGKKGWINRFAGLAALDVPRAGKLEVALSSRAYVDVVENGRTLKPTDFGRAGCAGVFKTVTYDVKPGRHTVQITDSQASSIKIGMTLR